jgi:hypothetical protein
VVTAVTRRPGTPLAPAIRREFERRLGHDFDAVRVHVDGEAIGATAALGARAFTLGRHVAIGNGLYPPSTPESRRLLAHELTHVAQQAAFGDHQLASAPVLEADHPTERQARAGAGATARLSAPAVQRDTAPAPFLGARPRPRSLAKDLNPEALSIAELEQEIRLLREWLVEESFSPDSRIHTFTLARLEAVLAGKQGQQRERVAREQRRREAVRKRWERYPDEKLEERFAKIVIDLAAERRFLEIPKAVEPLRQELARRRDVRRARPVTAPGTVAEAIGQLQEAWREAEKEDLPDWSRSVALVAAVDDWIQRLHTDWRDHFPGMSTMTLTSTGMILGYAVTGVRMLRHAQQYGPGALGGRWEYAINAVRSATDALQVLGNERPLEKSPIRKLSQAENRIELYEVAVPGVIAAAGVVIVAAPEIISAGLMWAAANPVLAVEVMTVGAATAVELGETGTVDPISLVYNLLHVQYARGGGGPRPGAGSGPDDPLPSPPTRSPAIPGAPAAEPAPPPSPSPPAPSRVAAPPPVATSPQPSPTTPTRPPASTGLPAGKLALWFRLRTAQIERGTGSAMAGAGQALEVPDVGPGGGRPTPALVEPGTAATAPPVGTAPARPVGQASMRAPKAPQTGPTIRQLRNRAEQDPEAAEELRLRFRAMSDKDLKKEMTRDPTGIARMVYESRIPPNVKLAEFEGKRGEQRPIRHEASARVIGVDGRERWSGGYESGGVTAEHREEHGWREANRLSHTERKAIRDANLAPGERLEIVGVYDPCPWCQQAMREVSLGGRTVEYWWPGGRFRAVNGVVTWTYVK